MSGCSIGTAAARTGMSADTLRYYERIGLMRGVPRDAGGRRCYTDAEFERLRFIARAQAMDFTLAEIGQLLELRDHPSTAREAARRLARDKLDAVTQRVRALRDLGAELRLLLSRCSDTADHCPILEMETEAKPTRQRRLAASRLKSDLPAAEI